MIEVVGGDVDHVAPRRELEAGVTEHRAVAVAERIDETLVHGIDAAEVEAFFGRDMRFSFGERTMDFTAENFLLSFSQPNFYFHATTAYDILRWKGLAIGKRDFMGRPRLKS